jgi:hypothetical protein
MITAMIAWELCPQLDRLEWGVKNLISSRSMQRKSSVFVGREGASLRQIPVWNNGSRFEIRPPKKLKCANRIAAEYLLLSSRLTQAVKCHLACLRRCTEVKFPVRWYI